MDQAIGGRLRHVLFGAYVVLALGGVTWPGYPLFGATIRPMVLGLPWSLVYVILWVLATFVAVGLYEWTRPKGEPR